MCRMTILDDEADWKYDFRRGDKLSRSFRQNDKNVT